MDPSRIEDDRRTRLAETDELVQTIVTTIADFEAVDPTELPPLYDAIDPDALVALLRSSGMDARVVFSYLGYEIIAHGGGDVTVIE